MKSRQFVVVFKDISYIRFNQFSRLIGISFMSLSLESGTGEKVFCTECKIERSTGNGRDSGWF